MTQEWYYADGDRTVGPLSPKQLKTAAANGTLRPTDLVWAGGTTNRVPASKINGLQFGTVPVAVPVAVPMTTDPASPPLHAAAAAGAPQWYEVGRRRRRGRRLLLSVGLLLVWRHPRWTTRTKGIVTGLAAVIGLGVVGASAQKGKGPTDPAANRATAGSEVKPGKAATKDYALPQKDFVAYTDQCLRSDIFVVLPADATSLPDELLTEEFLPYSAGAEGWWEKRVTLAGNVAILLFDRNEEGGGVYADVLTSVGDFKDGKRRITQSNLKKKSDQYRRRVRDGFVEFGLATRSGAVVQWERWVKVGARTGDKWPCRGEDGRESGTAELQAVFRYDDRPCALVRVSHSQVIGGKTVRTQESG